MEQPIGAAEVRDRLVVRDTSCRLSGSFTEKVDGLLVVAVVDAGSFTRAARSLGLPTSTVSRRVSMPDSAAAA